MARDTDTNLRNKVLYSIFVRNHTKEGTLKALEDDLDRIQELGTDYVWLLPIHPIGEVNRKGDLGSPYAIKDYRFIDPTLGTEEDFRHLVEEIHVGITGFGLMTKNIDTVHLNPNNQLSHLYSNERLNRRHNMNNYSRNDWDEEYYEEEMPHHSFENLQENRELERRSYPSRMPRHGPRNQTTFN